MSHPEIKKKLVCSICTLSAVIVLGCVIVFSCIDLYYSCWWTILYSTSWCNYLLCL